MNTTKYMILAGAAAALAACSSADEPAATVEAPVAAIVVGGIGDSRSRVVDASWNVGDMIGISTTSASNTQYANMKYQANSISGDFEHVGGKDSGIFFKYSEVVTFSAYYPFTGDEGKSAETISGISTADQTANSSLDYLFAQNTNASLANPNVTFTFSHMMTRIVLNISVASGIGLTFDDVRQGTFYLNGIKHSGTFNTATGEAAATDDANNDWEINARPTDNGSVLSYSLIVFPQTIPELTFKAIIKGKNYAGVFRNHTLTAGSSYAFDITIRGTDLKIGAPEISAWINGETGSGSANLDPFNGRKAVLMRKASLGQPTLYFATRNIGADAPEDAGLYFWWGDVIGHESGSGFDFSVENTPTSNKNIDELKKAGYIDNNYNLTPAKDAARQHWGGRWRMPTKDDIEWLVNSENCDWEWQADPAGYNVTSKTTGGKIFLPAAGRYDRTTFLNYNVDGCYWCSTISNSWDIWGNYTQGYLSFSRYAHNPSSGQPRFGLSVRPVSN